MSDISELPDDIPEEARPDCENCPKPELHPSNYDAVNLYYYVFNQQNWMGMDGYRGGVRTEALKVAMDELEAQGLINDRAKAFRRVHIIDAVVNASLNAQKSAQMSSDAAS